MHELFCVSLEDSDAESTETEEAWLRIQSGKGIEFGTIPVLF